MLFGPAKVPLKVFSILFKIHWVCCVLCLIHAVFFRIFLQRFLFSLRFYCKVFMQGATRCCFFQRLKLHKYNNPWTPLSLDKGLNPSKVDVWNPCQVWRVVAATTILKKVLQIAFFSSNCISNQRIQKNRVQWWLFQLFILHQLSKNTKN